MARCRRFYNRFDHQYPDVRSGHYPSAQNNRLQLPENNHYIFKNLAVRRCYGFDRYKFKKLLEYIYRGFCFRFNLFRRPVRLERFQKRRYCQHLAVIQENLAQALLF